MRHRYASVTATALAVALALALGACQSSGPSPTQATDQPTTAGETMTYTSVDEALTAHREAAVRSLDEVLSMFDNAPDPEQVDRYRRELRPACTFDPDPPLSINVGTRFQSDDPGTAVEGAVAAAVEADWTRVESTSSSDQSHFFRRGDFILTVSWGRENWVNVSVESPCFASDGTRVS